jgi:hypothetical protein
MPTLVLENEPLARHVVVAYDVILVGLSDGRSLSVPLTWYPRLMNATAAEQQNVNLLGDGYAMEWPDLDEHIGTEGLLAGRRSGESDESFQRWLASRKAS